MKRLKNIVSKSQIREALACVNVTEERIEATDSFRYVSLKNIENTPVGMYNLKTGEKKDLTFPDVSVIKAGLKNDLVIRVNRKYLIEVLQALGKGDSFDTLDMKIDVTGAKIKPIVFENTNGDALLMPFNY